jgi:hypothetical protein
MHRVQLKKIVVRRVRLEFFIIISDVCVIGAFQACFLGFYGWRLLGLAGHEEHGDLVVLKYLE